MLLFLSVALAQFTETARVQADLDGDGDTELIVAGFGADHAIQVAVTERNGQTTRLDLGSRGDIFGPRDTFELHVTPARETGVPLAHIFVPGGEYCGSGDTSIYISYSQEAAKTRLQPALEVGSFFDAPIWSHTELNFDPRRKSVLVVTSWGGEEGHQGRERERRVFRDGVFASR
jgi:hypothetical protein